MTDREKKAYFDAAALRAIRSLLVDQEGNTEWDHVIVCKLCGLRQVFWGVEAYDDYEDYPARFVKQVMRAERLKDDALASQMCYYFFGWRSVDANNSCPSCVPTEQDAVLGHPKES